jgi:hypothetical protein
MRGQDQTDLDEHLARGRCIAGKRSMTNHALHAVVGAPDRAMGRPHDARDWTPTA